MCTVTFLPLGKSNFLLTSSRDENPSRKTIHPKKYIENNSTLIYPKDNTASGSWIGMNEQGSLVCLLNGGYEKHQRKEHYRMSRGLLVKQILQASNPVDFVNNYDFIGIEPFTMVIVVWRDSMKLYELIWDEEKPHFNQLKNEPKIWSSSTLYTQEMKKYRNELFLQWLNSNKVFSQKKILEFHQQQDHDKVDYSIKMKRDMVETVSITSVINQDKQLQMDYLDVLDNSCTKISF